MKSDFVAVALFMVSFNILVSLSALLQAKEEKQNNLTPFIHQILFNNITLALQSTINIWYI